MRKSVSVAFFSLMSTLLIFGTVIMGPYGRDLGLGYRVRTLPLGRDRWGIYSTGERLHPLAPEVSVPRKRGNRRGCKDH